MTACLLMAADLSLAGTGLAAAVFPPDSPPKITVMTVKAPPRRGDALVPMPERHSQILGPLFGHLDAYREIPRLVVKEQRLAPAHGREPGSATNAQDLAGLHAVAEYGLWRRGVPCVDVPGPTLKKFATGKHQCTKEDVRVAAAKRLEHLVVCSNNNESDALWLLVMVCWFYGYPLAQLPVSQQISIDKITWPAVAGLDLKGVPGAVR